MPGYALTWTISKYSMESLAIHECWMPQQVAGQLSLEQYVEALHQAMLEDAADKLASGEERAALSALRKAELKASGPHVPA